MPFVVCALSAVVLICCLHDLLIDGTNLFPSVVIALAESYKSLHNNVKKFIILPGAILYYFLFCKIRTH